MIHRSHHATRYPTPGLVALGFLSLALTGCPAPDDPPPEEPGPPEGETRTAPAAGAHVLDASCTNENFGFRTRHPSDWAVNEGDGLPPCSAFDPEDASMPAVGEIPLDIAIVVREETVEFERTTDFSADFTVEIRTLDEGTVAGRPAVAAYLESTGEGMYPEGQRSYTWFVDLGGTTLMGSTHDVEGSAGLPFDERRAILDSMMDTVELLEADDS